MIQSKIIIAIVVAVAVVAVGVTVVVKVVGGNDKPTKVQIVAPPDAPYGGRGQPPGEIIHSTPKEY